MNTWGQVERELGVQTASIVSLDDLIATSRGKGNERKIERLEECRRRYDIRLVIDD